MAKYIKLRRRVDDRYDGGQFDLEKIGEDSYRLITGGPDEHDFSNRMKAERFDGEFVDKYNSMCEEEDRFELRSREAYWALTELRKRLERGDNEIRLKVKD